MFCKYRFGRLWRGTPPRFRCRIVALMVNSSDLEQATKCHFVPAVKLNQPFRFRLAFPAPVDQFSVRHFEKRMATVSTFSKPEEAHLLRSRLEAAGIPAFVRDELTIQMNWLYSTALGGVRVEVADEHLEAAREITALPTVNDSREETLLCPRCGSSEVIRRQWPRRLAYLSLLVVSFPLILSRKHSKCRRCGCAWK
jgi:hypothetical protein